MGVASVLGRIALHLLLGSLQVGDSVHSMAEFKSYLESRGAVLAQSEDFATFCALPYIPDPTRHPSFKALFTVCTLLLNHLSLS